MIIRKVLMPTLMKYFPGDIVTLDALGDLVVYPKPKFQFDDYMDPPDNNLAIVISVPNEPTVFINEVIVLASDGVVYHVGSGYVGLVR